MTRWSGQRTSTPSATTPGPNRASLRPSASEPQNVGFWHKADITIAANDVCFQGYSGYRRDATKFPLLTRKETCRRQLLSRVMSSRLNSANGFDGVESAGPRRVRLRLDRA